MPTCRICLRTLAGLRFQTKHVAVCAECINAINEAGQPAQGGFDHIGGLLRKGMEKNRGGFVSQAEYERALPEWTNKLLAQHNRTLPFQQARAHRRGLLRLTGGASWDYPANWIEQAQRIRKRDKCCQDCGASGVRLDVHHIVYLSNFGTNRQENLITLCRPCHEKLHGRVFDSGEAEEPGNPDPIRPPQSKPSSGSPRPISVKHGFNPRNPGIWLPPTPPIDTPNQDADGQQSDRRLIEPTAPTPPPPRDRERQQQYAEAQIRRDMAQAQREAVERHASPIETPANPPPGVNTSDDTHGDHPPTINQSDVAKAKTPKHPTVENQINATLIAAISSILVVSGLFGLYAFDSHMQGVFVAPEAAAIPEPTTKQQLHAIMDKAMRRWPYLNTPAGLEASREMIQVRDRLLAEGHPPVEALRTAVEQVAPKHAPHGSEP